MSGPQKKVGPVRAECVLWGAFSSAIFSFFFVPGSSCQCVCAGVNLVFDVFDFDQ